MPENTKILNIQKLLILILSYQQSERATGGDGKVAKLNNTLIKKAFFADIIEKNNFSELDDITLKGLTLLPNTHFDFQKLKSLIRHWVSDNLIPDNNKPLLNKFGIQSLNINKLVSVLNTLGIKSFKENKLDAAEREIATALISQKNIDTVWKLFIEGINLEMQKREKKLNKIGVNTDSSVDDSLLVAFNKKINDCETFNDVENLLLLYTTAKGCDFINGFLRGDMSTVKSKNTKIKSSWGTDLHVSFNILLDSAIKALELRKILMYGDLKDTIQVYRGLNMMGFFKFINFKDSDSILFKSQDNDRDTMRKMVINYLRQNRVYKDKKE